MTQFLLNFLLHHVPCHITHWIYAQISSPLSKFVRRISHTQYEQQCACTLVLVLSHLTLVWEYNLDQHQKLSCMLYMIFPSAVTTMWVKFFFCYVSQYVPVQNQYNLNEHLHDTLCLSSKTVNHNHTNKLLYPHPQFMKYNEYRHSLQVSLI